MVDRVKEHASFLIAQFKQDDFDWQETIVYQWLAAEHAVRLSSHLLAPIAKCSAGHFEKG